MRTKIMAMTATASLLFSMMSHCVCDDAPITDSASVLNGAGKAVDAIVVHARFLTGAELNDLQKLIGVPAETLDQESAASSRELFLVLRIKASGKVPGVPCTVKLQLANDSPLVRQTPMMEFEPLFPHETQMRIIKLHSFSDQRFGGNPYGSEELADEPEDLDLVNELHQQKPIFRLRRMMLK